jgi:hypothetical protein
MAKPAPAKDLQGEALLNRLAHIAQARYGLTVWQWKGHGEVGQHATASLHFQTYPDGIGRAFDAYGPWRKMFAFARYVAHNAPQVTEGIFNSRIPGHNLSIKRGERVPASFWGDATWSGHTNHVHIGV